MVKVFRDEPEFVGGPVTAAVPESALEEAKSNGWKVAEVKSAKKEEPKVEKPAEDPVAEEPKVEKPKAPKKKLD